MDNFYSHSEIKIDKTKYLMVCDQLGEEPDPERMPADFGDFPKIVQDAIVIYSILPDVWEGFGGTFLGKDYSILPYLSNQVYEIEDHAQLMQFLIMINNIVSKYRAEKQKLNNAKNKRKGK